MNLSTHDAFASAEIRYTRFASNWLLLIQFEYRNTFSLITRFRLRFVCSLPNHYYQFTEDIEPLISVFEFTITQ